MRREDGLEFFILNVDELQSLERRPLVDRDHGGHRLAGVANFVDSEERMILYRVTVVRIQPIEIISGNYAVDARVGFRFGLVDGDNFCVGVGAAQNLGVGHADEPEIAHIGGFSRDFDPAIAARYRMVDDLKIGFLFRAHFLLSLAITSDAR